MSKKLSEKIKDLIMTHITNPTSVGYGKTWDWFEKHSHFGEFYRGAVELEQRIAELEERNDELSSIDEMLSETVENMRETIVSLTVGDSVEFDLHCPKCGDDIRQMLHANPIEGEHEYELLNRIAELEEQLLKVSKEYAEMSFARRVNKHNETIRDSVKHE